MKFILKNKIYRVIKRYFHFYSKQINKVIIIFLFKHIFTRIIFNFLNMNEINTALDQILDEAAMENDGWKVIDPLEINQEITSYKRKEELKNELNILLEETNPNEKDIDDNDGWYVLNFSDLNQHKLLLYANEHRNEEENQTQVYSDLISNWNNFVKADLKNRIRHHLPVIAKSFWNLFLSFGNELTEYSEITSYAVELNQQFIEIVECAKNEVDDVYLKEYFITFKNMDPEIFALSAAEKNEKNLALEKISAVLYYVK